MRQNHMQCIPPLSIPPFPLLFSSSSQNTSRQRSNNPFKSHKSHRIRRKRPQKTRYKPPPIPLRPLLEPNIPRRIPPLPVSPLPILQRATERICHNPLLDHIGWVAGQPKYLGGETAGPEVYAGDGEVGFICEERGEQGVGAPPEEEEGAED